MLIAITHTVSEKIRDCELTYIDRSPIDYRIARCQHEDYRLLLTSLDIEVINLSDNLDCADGCFVEDTAIVVDEIAIITSMGVASRRAETAAIRRALTDYREIAEIELPALIEGGDVLRIDKKLFVGISQRTNEQGYRALQEILTRFDYQVIPVEVKGSLHLKTACTAIDSETLLANPDWVDLAPFAGLDIIATPTAEPWGANSLRIGDQIIIPARLPDTASLLRDHGLEVLQLDISEFQKAEAGLTCLSIIFQS